MREDLREEKTKKNDSHKLHQRLGLKTRRTKKYIPSPNSVNKVSKENIKVEADEVDLPEGVKYGIWLCGLRKVVDQILKNICKNVV